MVKEVSYSLFFIPEASGKIKKFRLSESHLRWVVGVLAVSLLFFAFNVVGFWYYRSLYTSLEKDREVVATFEKEKKDLIGKVTGLERTLGDTEKMAEKLASLVGTERVPLHKGVGPIPLNRFSISKGTASISLSSLDPKLDRLEDRALTLQMKIQELTKVQEDKLIYIASTPSIWPVKGWVTSDFGYRRSPFTLAPDFHAGIDIAAQWGTPIAAAADGVVTYAAYKGGLGRTVIVDHGFGVTTQYGHNSSLLVHEGQRIKKGEKIALIGSTGHATGPHLHYEIRVDRVPVDPMRYLQ